MSIIAKKEKFKREFQNVCDITKVDGDWLCKENQKLYKVQIESRGSVGYTTSIVAPKLTYELSVVLMVFRKYF